MKLRAPDAMSNRDQRTDDATTLAQKLINYPPFDRFQLAVVCKLAGFGCCEELDSGIVLFRQGDVSCNWYALLDGSIDVLVRVAATTTSTTTTSYADDLRPAIIPIKEIVGDFCRANSFVRRDFPEMWPMRKRSSQQPQRDNNALGCSANNGQASPSAFAVVDKLKNGGPDRRHRPPPPSFANANDRCSSSPDVLLSQQAVVVGGGQEVKASAANAAAAAAASNATTSDANLLAQRMLNDLGTCDSTSFSHIVTPKASSLKNGSSSRGPRSVMIATPSIMEKMAAKTSQMTINDFADEVRLLPETVIDGSDPEMTGYKPEQNSMTTRVQQKNVIELSNTMSSDSRLCWAAGVLRAAVAARSSTLVRDRKYQLVLYKRCMVGTEMVDWLLQNSDGLVQSRMQAVGMWQACVEAGLLSHVTHEYPFMDKYLLYRWAEDEGAPGTVVRQPTLDEQRQAELEFPSALSSLAHVGPDAMFRMILRKAPQERSSDELEVVFEELLNIKALSHLSTMVKRELAAVMMFEQHSNAGTILFRQGDEGKSWYIILRGSVNVVIHGKGTVCTLHEGDDFGKLALVNDAPRAATIILNEDNSQFLRVDKHDFNRILRDVEANTVRLKEHGRDVLVLEKIPIRPAPSTSGAQQQPQQHQQHQQQHRYSVMAGTPEKMLEYLLETRIDCEKDDSLSDTFMDDFLLTHLVFIPTNILCNALSIYYQQGCSTSDRQRIPYDDPSMVSQSTDLIMVNRRRVVAFLQQWINVAGYTFFQDPAGTAFVKEIYSAVLADVGNQAPLQHELSIMETLIAEREHAMNATSRRPNIVLDCGILRNFPEQSPAVLPFDTCVFRVYNPDGAYVTLKTSVDQSTKQVKTMAAQKLRMSTSDNQSIELVEVKSNMERVIYASSEISVPSLTGLNSVLFVCYKDQVESLTPLPEQDGPTDSVHSATLELLGSSELSQQLLLNHWQLFSNAHLYEFIYQTFGRDRFHGRVPTNLDLLVRRFNEVQFWVVTEIVLCSNLSKRVALIKKFIKVAAHSKTLHDLLTFFAIVLGLSNVAVSRLTMTWEKLPTKTRKQFVEFESLLDPARNHRAYRMLISKMYPPIIPFVPLILKDLTFTHDGNKTYFDGLVNFEKMHMIAQTLRSIRYCKSQPLAPEFGLSRGAQEAQQLVKNFKVIDDQKKLLFLSQKLEPRKQSC